MPLTINTQKKKLIEDVLQYWYVVDFLGQLALKTEQTKTDNEQYSFVMKYPERFRSLYRHVDLTDQDDMLDSILVLEQTVNSRKKEAYASKNDQRVPKPCCHGRVTVNLGSIRRAFLSERIARQMQCEPPLNPSSDNLAWASLQLDETGKYIDSTFSVSPVIWATLRIAQKTADMTMYDVLDYDAYAEIEKSLSQSCSGRLTSYELLSDLLKKLNERLIIPLGGEIEESEAKPSVHYTYSIYRDEKERSIRDSGEYYRLSSSFYADDLFNFRRTATEDKWLDTAMWRALADYICAPYDMKYSPQALRFDLGIDALRNAKTKKKAQESLRDILAINKNPWGKWPSKHRPFFMQQIAINTAINAEQPITAINGPPGTGKTTLIKEIVADYVVKKALILSSFDNPDDAFVKQEPDAAKPYRFQYYSYTNAAKALTQYSLVVASSNNTAVENISKKLPLQEPLEKGLPDPIDLLSKSVCRRFSLSEANKWVVSRKNFEKEGQPHEPVEFPEIYFSTYATALSYDAACWGLLGAALGKRGNVLSFYNKVINQFDWDYIKSGNPRQRLPQFIEARDRFKKQYELVKKLREELTERITRAQREKLSEEGTGIDHFICLTDAYFDALCSADDEKRTKAHTLNPWSTDRYDREREKLFFDALQLTREFILSSKACQVNLTLLGKAWGCDSYDTTFKISDSNQKNEALKTCMTALIQTLQLMVPVISTTFASAGRFFQHVNKLEALGTIIVDEAGQATPQMAIRLFSKAAKAIVIGDPHQIDPVVSDELMFIATTLDEEISDAYSNRTLSVQQIADYLSPYGATQTDSNNGVEYSSRIGIPLYIHSRCIDPMFSISNGLSYDDSMLKITKQPSQEQCKTFCHQASQWINVTGTEIGSKNHFVLSQGKRVLELLNRSFELYTRPLNSERIDGPDIFIISPFHTVADGMSQLLSRSLNDEYPFLKANRDIINNWLSDDQNPHIGTVHSFQGKEASEVIFLLGCDKEARKSAKWVNRNIVNVAVSRAKYRLYVVGDVNVWDVCVPVMEMKFHLDTYPYKLMQEASVVSSNAEESPLSVLPTSEVFDNIPAEEGNASADEISVDHNMANLQAIFSSSTDELTSAQLNPFGIQSLEQIHVLFSSEAEQLVYTGIMLYAIVMPFASQMPENYDVSAVAVYFSKAFEHMLVKSFLPLLKQWLPQAAIRGQRLSEMQDAKLMIGDILSLLTESRQSLGALAVKDGCFELDAHWWDCLLTKMMAAKELRNLCCHAGNAFTCAQLESLIALLFHVSDMLVSNSTNEKRTIRGLLFEIAHITEIAAQKDNAAKFHKLACDNSREAEQCIDRYCRIKKRIWLCPVDTTALKQKGVSVMTVSGITKKLNMQVCPKCGRCFLDPGRLTETVRLSEYILKPVEASKW